MARHLPWSAITGLGSAGLTRVATPPAGVLAVEAIRAAIADSGLAFADIDGLLVARSGAATESDPDLDLQRLAGLRDLRLLQVIHCEGASAIQMITTATLAVRAGMARHVVCVFADAALQPDKRTSESFGRIKSVRGMAGLRYAAGAIGGVASHAMVAQRVMARYGWTSADLGAVAISNRRWAELNPDALMRKPLTMEDYLAARWIVEPFRLFDCAMPVNGAVAVIVSRADATDLRQPPVFVHGMGQGHRGPPNQAGEDEPVTGAAMAGAMACAMAGITPAAIEQCQIYDAFTFNTLMMLQEYGLCARGDAGAFVRSGATAPGGSMPTNTGGGHLSGSYLQGMTPVAEAIVQARGQGGARQCARHGMILVTNEGGQFDYHACLLVGTGRD